MKKILILLVVCCTTGIFSCDEDIMYAHVERSVTKDRTLHFIIETSGTINVSSSVSPREIVRTLTNDLAEDLAQRDFVIKSLTFQSLGFKMIKASTNTATGVVFGSFIATGSNPAEKPLLEEHNYSISEVEIVAASLYLKVTGVNEINTALAAAIKDVGGQNLNIRINGRTLPENSKAVIQLIMNMKFNIEYSYCEEVPGFVINPFDECIL